MSSTPYNPALVAEGIPSDKWIKATASTGQGGACVELAPNPEGGAYLRDSKLPGFALSYTQEELAAFLEGARNGEFDHLLG